MPRNQESFSWIDRNGRAWLSCDSCWAAVADDQSFVASVDGDRCFEAGAFYCRACALALIEKWRLQLAETALEQSEARP